MQKGLGSNRGTSILWFLGLCLLMVEAVITALSYKLCDYSFHPIVLLFFAFLSLATVVGALLYMFMKNPAYLIAEKGQLTTLLSFQEMAKHNSPDLLRWALMKADISKIGEGEAGYTDDTDVPDEEVLAEPEVGNVEEADEEKAALEELLEQLRESEQHV